MVPEGNLSQIELFWSAIVCDLEHLLRLLHTVLILVVAVCCASLAGVREEDKALRHNVRRHMTLAIIEHTAVATAGRFSTFYPTMPWERYVRAVAENDFVRCKVTKSLLLEVSPNGTLHLRAGRSTLMHQVPEARHLNCVGPR